ncbi:DUF6438 domain-containing protein [Hymenobacter sp. H14-R3]|uniref:DUF6438 domain-containing protein n=1 Tax=Hymenobacter sp. H14-R3 TaxID=3046308 RepID=UPI0024B8B073|nr:DUF6438 domain-containing protein [Hymenobacter sp. H14-R3]MDJ0366386.1 DUF6438 domain-containing protein [Hymenobacter sp. H14-R3]
MRSLLWLLALSLALPACAQQKPPRKTKAVRAAAVPKEAAPVLVFQRTPCNGTCPVYTATVFADGRVEYDGQRFVKFLGKQTLSLPVATINDILAEAKRINFSQFDERYSGLTVDLPAAIITVQPVGQPRHAVLAEEGFPPSLKAYIDYVGARIDPLTQQSLEK